jgi:hypothetical protein
MGAIRQFRFERVPHIFGRRSIERRRPFGWQSTAGVVRSQQKPMKLAE